MIDRRLFLTALWAWLSLAPAYGQTLKVTEMPQQTIPVALGQYSGITWILLIKTANVMSNQKTLSYLSVQLKNALLKICSQS